MGRGQLGQAEQLLIIIQLYPLFFYPLLLLSTVNYYPTINYDSEERAEFGVSEPPRRNSFPLCSKGFP